MLLLFLHEGKGSPSKTETSSLTATPTDFCVQNKLSADGHIGWSLCCSILEEIFGAFFHSSPIHTMRDGTAQCVHCLPSFSLFHALWCVINKQQAFHTMEKQ